MRIHIFENLIWSENITDNLYKGKKRTNYRLADLLTNSFNGRKRKEIKEEMNE